MYDIDSWIDCGPLRHITMQTELRDYQVISALGVATTNGQILMYQTGLGKTLSVLAGLVMRKNANISKNILWIGPLATFKQVISSIKDETEMNISVIRGNENNLKNFHKFDPNLTDILLVNMEAFDNPKVIEIFRMFSILKMFDTVVIDEAHLICKPYHSNRNSFIYMLAYRIDNVYLLTATPIISEIQQYASALALISKNLPDLFGIIARVHQGDYKPENVKHIVKYKGRDEEYPSKVHLIKTGMVVERAPGISVFKYTRGNDANAVNNKLIEIIKSHGLNPHFIIHCYLTEHHKFLKHFIEETLDLRVGIVSGEISQQERFNNGDLDCVIFSISTGLNLPSDFLIMYDWTVYTTQAIGRGLRTLEIGTYVVHFLITDCLKEIQLCKNSIIKNGFLTDKALGFSPLKQLIGGIENV